MSEKPSTRPRPRIQALSDLIFGLALSISALTLISQQPATIQELSFSLGLYGFSFLILISVWRLYSTVTSILPVETSFLTNLNIILLFLVSIEPYLFNELFVLTGDLNAYASNLYAFDLGAMFLIMAFFNHFLAIEEKKLVPRELLSVFRLNRNISIVVAIILIISILPFFGSIVVYTTSVGSISYNLYLRNVLWIIALFAGWSRYFLEKFFK